MRTITEWRLVKNCKGIYVSGMLDGNHITTSYVVDYASVNGVLLSIKTKSGSVYHLRNVDPTFCEYANAFGENQFAPIPDNIIGLNPLQVPTHGVIPDEHILWHVERLDNGLWKGYAVEDYHCLVRFTESIAHSLEDARDSVIDNLRQRILREGQHPRSSVGVSLDD